MYVLYSYDGHNYSNGWYDDLDGPLEPSDDIDGPATWDNIQTTITNLTEDLGHGDQLAVFFTGVPVQNVGGNYHFSFWNENIGGSYLKSDDVSLISVPMEAIDCGHMIFTFDVNSSSDIAAYFEPPVGSEYICLNRYFHGSTGTGEESLEELYITGGIYSEQLYYWASAARGHLPETFAPWNIWLDPQSNPIPLGKENGGFPYADYITGHPDDQKLDDNEDGIIQMEEVFNYADEMNTWSPTYCYLPYNDDSENPFMQNNFPFEEDLLNLNALTGSINSSQVISGRSYIILDILSVSPGVSLTFESGAEFYITSTYGFYMGLISAEEGSYLTLGDNAKIINPYPSYSIGVLSCYGESLVLGKNTQFIESFLGVGGPSNIVLDEVFFFNSEIIIWDCNEISIMNSEFNDTYIEFTDFSYLSLTENNVFNNCDPLVLNGTAPMGLETVQIDYCHFSQTNGSNYGLLINNVSNYSITNSTSKNGSSVKIENSGWGNTRLIENNDISGNLTGIEIYNSSSKLKNNYIFTNLSEGLIILNNSNVDLVGNPFAHYEYETQRIMDNGGHEIRTDEGSFPKMKWNAIIDDNNLGLLMYCQDPVTFEKDVRYNYWGNDFDPNFDFYPVGAYIYDPIFELIYNGEEKSDAELLYESGKEKFISENYTGAKVDFQQVVQQYPESKFAKASLKELYVVEKFLNCI